jgi:hypothetical protein
VITSKARKYKRSIRNNNARRRTRFKPEHKFFQVKNENVPDNCIPPTDDSTQQFERQITEEAEEVQYLAQKGPQDTLNAKPAKEVEEYSEILYDNIFVNMTRMAEFLPTVSIDRHAQDLTSKFRLITEMGFALHCPQFAPVATLNLHLL